MAYSDVVDNLHRIGAHMKIKQFYKLALQSLGLLFTGGVLGMLVTAVDTVYIQATFGALSLVFMLASIKPLYKMQKGI